MGAVYFYHLTRQPLERTLPLLLDKALGADWRVEVRCPDLQRAAWLDEKLWLNPEDRFLPHGLAGSEDDNLHPVLLTTHPVENVDCIISVEGSDVSADEVREKDRVCILFDGNDETMLSHARQQWKILSDAKCHLQYWSEETGHWKKKAEANSPE
tara:strand:+ start:1170 stop:1634 length:465 start_codon:yes stop_codon:yes gene_type:complete